MTVLAVGDVGLQNALFCQWRGYGVWGRCVEGREGVLKEAEVALEAVGVFGCGGGEVGKRGEGVQESGTEEVVVGVLCLGEDGIG